MNKQINCLIVKYGEIALRGKNRAIYENMLIQQIKSIIDTKYYIRKEQGRFYIDEPNNPLTEYENLAKQIIKIPGIHSVCPCLRLESEDIEDIKEASIVISKLAFSKLCQNTSFKVNTRRADKRYQFTSHETSYLIGEHILNYFDNISVDVHNPQVIINIELRTYVYVYSKEFKGLGGLPVSSSGKAVYLLSGGIDSPIASFLMTLRGVYGEFIYFHSPPYVSIKARQKVIDLAGKLAEYSGETKLHIVNFTDIQLLLKEKTSEHKLTLLMKRNMIRIACMLADEERMQALVTGDSVGQVASQTLASMHAIDSASSYPILRPLSGYSKDEIIRIAKKIETFDISIRPYEDCCTLFVSKHPETRPLKKAIELAEASVENINELCEKAFKEREIIHIK